MPKPKTTTDPKIGDILVDPDGDCYVLVETTFGFCCILLNGRGDTWGGFARTIGGATMGLTPTMFRANLKNA